MLNSLLAGALLAMAAPQQMDTTFDVGSARRLEVENHDGTIVVRSWDRNAVRVRATFGGTTRVDVDRRDGAISIEPESRRGRPGRSDLELTVPQRFDLQLEGLNTNIDVGAVQGNLDLETINGSITIAGASGRLDLSSISGRITVRDAQGMLDAEGTNEGIDVAGFTGNVSVATVNGSLTLARIQADRVEAETINGRIEYEGTLRDRGNYEFSSHNGEVVLYVAEGTNASINISTHNGEIDSAFPIQLRQASGRSRTSFTVGTGRGAVIEITSFSGPIRIRRPVR
ncbi:MAG: DUF4097 family beta strand repeat-containing protein [Longimicrobiales bacterium]